MEILIGGKLPKIIINMEFVGEKKNGEESTTSRRAVEVSLNQTCGDNQKRF